MNVNFGFFVSKFLRAINRPALRGCKIDKTAKVGTGSNCINVQMGRYSYMGKNNSVCNANIGSFCSIASYCAIGGGDHAMDSISTSPVFYEGRNIFEKHFSQIHKELNKPVTIGNDVWIGENVFINSGITIGDGAVIGAHSVVTHNVPPYAIAVGAPAKIIKYRFNDSEIERLLSIKWWNWTDGELTEKGQKFSSIESFFGR